MDSTLMTQALVAHRSGRWAEAERLYLDEIALHPANADAWALLGCARSSLGQTESALICIEKAIALDPKAGLFPFYLGNVLAESGEAARAVAAFQQSLALQPDLAMAQYNMGNALRLLGRWDEAGQAYEAALRLVPTYVEARQNLALVLEHQERFDDALALLRQVVRLRADDVEAWINLCRVAEVTGHYQEALDAGQWAQALSPNNASVFLGIGVALNRLGRHDQALEAYQTALRLKPDWTEVWDNIGQTYQFMNRLDEALEAFRKTVSAAGQAIPDDDPARVPENRLGDRHWHLALLELLRGDYRNGFARYRARFTALGLHRPAMTQPVWQGCAIDGKTILVADEQGMGDCLMLARYLPLLKRQRGAKVVLLVQEALVPLFQGWAGVDAVIPRGAPVGDFDYYASIFDLPFAFGTEIESIPQACPYLPVLAPDAATLLPPDPAFRVGVVWAGAPKHKHDARRSLPLASFSRLFDEQAVRFYNMNRDMRAGDAEILARYPAVIDLVPRLTDFAAVARFVQQMDLIITCDTATAHLAGAMGKQVWTLLPFAPDWRWLLDRQDSVWYPTMRLFRQAEPDAWDAVIADVRAALTERLSL